MSSNSRRRFLKIAAASAVLSCAPAQGDSGGQCFKGRSVGDSSKFFEACRSGDLATVQRLVAANRQLIAEKNEGLQSGFATALLHGHKPVAEFLRSEGYLSDLHETALAGDWKRLDEGFGDRTDEISELANADHPVGGTAMFAAAAGGAGADTWRIYSLGCDPNISPRAEKGIAPLQIALRFKDLPVAEITAASLLSNNTNPNPAPNADAPPIVIAAERGSAELVEMLIRLGAQMDATDAKGQTAAQVAGRLGHEKVHAMLEEHHKIPRTCRTSRTAFNAEGKPYRAPDISRIPDHLRRKFVGQSHGNLEFVQASLRDDPEMAHSVDITSEICVEACAHIGRKPIVEVLLQHGSPYSLPTAVMMGDMETVQRYLAEDPNRIHERGAHDFGLLWYPVIGQCNLDMTQFLLDQGAAIEQQHYLGTTALHWACMRGTIELVELLIDNGADVNRIARKFRSEGETPLDIAKSTKNAKVVQLLQDRGAK